MTSTEIRQSFLDFFREKAAHDRAVVFAAAGRAESAFHQCRHESVRAHFSRPTKAAVRTRRAWPTRRNAFAPAANITISKTSGSTPITTPFSRCWATGVLAIISRRKRSSGRGNYWSRAGNFRRNGFTRPFTNPARASRASSIRKPTIIWADYFAKPISTPQFTSSTATRKTISG